MPHKIFKLGTESHETPVGTSFAPSAWIGPAKAGHVYAVGWVEFNLEQLYSDYNNDLRTVLDETDEVTNERWVDLLVREHGVADLIETSRAGDKFNYIYRDPDQAAVLARLLNLEEPAASRSGRPFDRRPSHLWRLEMPIADVLTISDEGKEKFETDVMVFSVEQKGIAKNSPSWWRWHGMTLPSLVAAYATLMKWKSPGFDLGEFLVPDDEFIVTADFEERMVGNGEVGYDKSVLWQRRIDLWAALGEKDAKISDPDKTESDKLKEALMVATHNWEDAVFCRVIQVPSPRVDDVWTTPEGQARRNRVPVVTAFYTSERTATTAAKAEREDLEIEVSADEPDAEPDAESDTEETASSGDSVPEAWREYPDDWYTAVNEIRETVLDGKNRPMPVVKKALTGMAKRLAEEYMTTPEEVLSWWDKV